MSGKAEKNLKNFLLSSYLQHSKLYFSFFFNYLFCTFLPTRPAVASVAAMVLARKVWVTFPTGTLGSRFFFTTSVCPVSLGVSGT